MFAFVGYSSVLNNRPGSKQSSRAPKIQDLVEQCLGSSLVQKIKKMDMNGRLSAFFWQSFGKYLERKKYLVDFWILIFVFLLNFVTNFGEKLDKNLPKKC